MKSQNRIETSLAGNRKGETLSGSRLMYMIKSTFRLHCPEVERASPGQLTTIDVEDSRARVECARIEAETQFRMAQKSL